MTRKHFIALAEALLISKPLTDEHNIDPSIETYNAWRETVENVAVTCQGFNMSFDRDRFLTACGV